MKLISLKAVKSGRTALGLVMLFLANSAQAAESVAMVADINPGTRGSYPSFMTVFQDQLYFRGNTGLNDTELWCYDGTNVFLAADVLPGSTGSSPANLAVLGHKLYFNATTAAGYRVWSWDGATAARVTNANPPYALFESAFWKPVIWNGELCYPSQGKIHFFNGERFATLNAPPWAQMDLVLWNGALYYGAQDTNGVEIWRFNGVIQTRLSDINPGAGDANPEAMCATTNGIYFRARDGVSGHELYRYNGSSVQRVADIYPGPGSSNPSDFCAYHGWIYFCADNGVHGYELWRTDGGTTTELVADLNPNPIYEEGGDRYSDSYPYRLTVWRDRLYFVARVGWDGGLWCHDGTNTWLVGGGTANGDGNLNGVNEMVVFRDQLYFDADDGVHGRELWRMIANPEPRLEITSQNGVMELQLSQAETGSYVIEGSTDLSQWTPVATNSVRDGRFQFNDAVATNLIRRIYRAVPAAQP